MKRFSKYMTVASILLMMAQGIDVSAQSLNERRGILVNELQFGKTETYTAQEVEAYITGEEIKVRDAGVVDPNMSNLGIENRYTKGQILYLQSYLLAYLDNSQNSLPNPTASLNTPPSEQAVSPWTLAEDWRMLSLRRGDVPPVAWVMMSESDGVNYAVEPAINGENIISGYTNPAYTIHAYTTHFISGETSDIVTVTPDENGYFAAELKVAIELTPTVQILDEASQVVFNQILPVYEYRPTPLAHESGYLTLERYFLNQNYIEGYTYPNAEVNIIRLGGYASMIRDIGQSDENGYFYFEVPGHAKNSTTTIVSVTHPETGEKISVAPYPWTQEELDTAQW